MNKKKISALLIASFVAINSIGSFTTINVLAETNSIEDRAALMEEEIPHSKMIASASSYEPSNSPQNAIDGNATTMWHTPWNGSAKLPQSLTLDLGGTNSISSIKISPRTSGSNGIITKYEIYAIKNDSEVKIASGKWEENNAPKSIILDEVVSADKIKIVALEGVGNYASIGEVNVYKVTGEVEKLSSYNNKSITSDATTVDITKYIGALKDLTEGTIVTRFDTNSSGLQALFGASNNKTNNGYFSLYVSGNRVGFELRNQTQEGNTSGGSTTIAHKYVDVALNKGINTVALKISNGIGYKIFVNGILALDVADSNASFLSSVQGLNSAYIGKADRFTGNKFIFNGDIDFIDIYGKPVSDNYLIKRTGETALPKEEDVMPDHIYKTEPEDIFYSGYLGSNNYRIPALFTTKEGTIISSIDARIPHGGDSPNNIDTAIRRRVLNENGEYGEWEEGKIIIDLPENASTIDTSLVQDKETGRIFLLATSFASGYGFPNAKTGSGYTEVEKDGVVYRYRSLYDSSNNLYTIRENGVVYDSNENPTEYKVTENNMDLYKGENKIDNVMTSTSPLKVLGTSFLSLVYSDDDGVTWSDPVDLNKDVKVDWMRFLGTGPGVGMQVKNGDHAGRLVFPVYLTNSSGFQSSAVIYSDDNGESWEIGETANDGRDLGNGEFGDAEHMTSGLQLTESQVVEMPNGQLKMFMRNTGSYVRIATSFDGGATWDSDVYEDSNLREPYCQLSVINYSRKIDGKDAIIFANPDSGSRSNGTVKIGLINQDGTHKNGEPKYTFDWKYKKVVKPGYYAYSCLTELPDGNIGLFYEGTPTTSMSYMEMGIDYLKYNIADSIEPAEIKSVNILDEDNKYLPGENIKFKITFNQTVSLVGDNNLTINIGGKDVTLTLVPEENSNEFTFIGTLPEDIEAGEYGVVLNANPNTKILNALGYDLILNEDKNLDIFVKIEDNEENEEVNKDALKISIDYAEELKSSDELEDVIPIVIKEFNEALELAKGVYGNKDASEAEVNTAFMRLASIIHMLEFKKGDKEALEQFIAMAEALNPKVYTSSSWEAMQLELEDAKSVFNDENAMENEVNEATNKLKLAIENLEAININKSALQKLVDIILTLDETQYIPSTWVPMATQLENANNILANADATQEQVDESYNNLLRSYLQLRLKADKSKLDDLINKVKNMDLSKYSSEDVSRINAELDNAIKVSNNEESTPKEVNEATEKLRTVVDEVALNNDNGSKPDNGTKPDSGSGSGNSSGDGSGSSDTSGSGSSSSGTTGKGSSGSKLPNTGGVQTGIFGVISALAGLSLFRKRNNKKDL